MLKPGNMFLGQWRAMVKMKSPIYAILSWVYDSSRFTCSFKGRCKKKNVFLGLCPKHRTPPTHRARLGQSRKKNVFFFTIFGALKHHEMARYDLPTYVLHVLGHFWMFAVKITEWLFSLKSLGLWTHLWTHLPIVWDKVPNKFGFFWHLP